MYNEEVYLIDINADLGEGAGLDAQIMPFISSCNIACGGHFGNINTIETTVSLANKYGVKVGAHPSFPDKDNFGRKVLTMTKSELSENVFHQLLQFYAVCEDLETPVHHIKPHGALYNYAAIDAPTADAVVNAIVATKARPFLYVQHGSILHKKAENLLPLKFEAFIDRNYESNGRLVSRTQPKALIETPEEAWMHLHRLVKEQKILSLDGQEVTIPASTYCIHGDNLQSVAILKHIELQMAQHSMKLARE